LELLRRGVNLKIKSFAYTVELQKPRKTGFSPGGNSSITRRGYGALEDRWGERARLAWDTIDMKPTRGIPAWMLHVMAVPFLGHQSFPSFHYETYGYASYFTAYALFPEVMARDFAQQADLAVLENRAAASRLPARFSRFSTPASA
jgi:hypothetical protein